MPKLEDRAINQYIKDIDQQDEMFPSYEQYGPAQYGPAQYGPAQYGPAQYGPALFLPAIEEGAKNCTACRRINFRLPTKA